MKKKDFKIALLLAFISFVAGLFLVPYQLDTLKETLSSGDYQKFINNIQIPMELVSVAASLQIFLTSLVLGFIGIKLARNTGLSFDILDSVFTKGKKVSFEKGPLLLSMLLGAAAALLIVGADRFYYQYRIDAIGDSTPEFSFRGMVTGVLYGGVLEEVLVRLFFMSLLVWLFLKVGKRNKENASPVFYWAAIVIASLVFAALHLPATSQLFGGLTEVIVLRCFLLNGIGGIFFGWLYWKKGFEYAIVAHMFAHISMQLLVIPLFY
ncbi:CPBP family intramembrane metalloprotease [Peribacillus saganii]|uniref:CPBP family intramembrane metalloprotease n=1 Tax=Peribacillus saganii TaxID=2303992 RepID=A0A372LLN3_9BACI|nr:CPBP family intramembrane glutamic endopeptidase [Peribacillus saganii]RFU67870.1 CPBP family intramembrane metalloprotease [Peribacillus saganii]